MTLLQGAMAAGMMIAQAFMIVLVIAVAAAILYLLSKTGNKPPPQDELQPPGQEAETQNRNMTATEGCATFFVIIAIVMLCFFLLVDVFTCNVQFD